MRPLSTAFISTYPPRQCGIGTFTYDLASSIAKVVGAPLKERSRIQVLAMHRANDSLRYDPEVGFLIRQHQRRDYLEAAEFLNISACEVVCLQHEYGIFGGDDGRYLLDLLEDLKKPVVTTLHTVLSRPSEGQLSVLQRVCERSARVVVIAERARTMLKEIYSVSPEKIVQIHHGVPDVPFMDPGYYKDQFQLEGRKVVLTFGLLGPGKGIEHAIEAVSLLVKDHPDLTYLILGATHPEVKRQFGESYRLGLEQRAEALGLKDHVQFFNQYVSLEQLCEFLLMADLYVTPYPVKEQISSGTLAYAMGCGKAIVSTPYWYAEECLAEGRGLLAPFGDVPAMAAQMNRLLSDEVERNQVRKRAYHFGRKMIWKEVAQKYIKTFQRATETGLPKLPVKRSIPFTLPDMRLDHLRALTDDTGLFQHAICATPLRSEGYTTDDNARALRFTVHHWTLFKDESILPLMQTYLSFLFHALDPKTRRFRNYLAYNRVWLDETGSEDCQGRALAAVACALVNSPHESVAELATKMFDIALAPIRTFTSPRAWAWIVIACNRYLRRFGGARDVREIREAMSTRLLQAFEGNTSEDWPWCENELTYDNARLCKALLVAGKVTDNGEKISAGLRCLDWLLRIQTKGEKGHLSLIGSNGWMKRSGERAQFDQQPIEAESLLGACREAFLITGDKKWQDEMRRCFNWFLGANDLNAPLCDFKTHGCRDGIHHHGVSQNQGAESTISWLTALLWMHEIELS